MYVPFLSLRLWSMKIEKIDGKYTRRRSRILFICLFESNEKKYIQSECKMNVILIKIYLIERKNEEKYYPGETIGGMKCDEGRKIIGLKVSFRLDILSPPLKATF